MLRFKFLIILFITLFSTVVYSKSSINGHGDCLSSEFRDITVRDALQIYADFKKLNIVMDTNISGSVDLTLHCVSSSVIIDSIL